MNLALRKRFSSMDDRFYGKRYCHKKAIKKILLLIIGPM